MRVLIVEDETLIRKGLLSMVDWAAEGFTTCLDVGSAVDALELLQDQDVDLVITDIFMPVINGLEMIRMAREMGSHAVFVILTGHERFEYAQEAIRLGVRRFLVKPVAAGELLETLREVRQELFAKRRDELSLAQTQERIQEYQAIIQEKYWSDLLDQGAPSAAEAAKRAEHYDIDLPHAAYLCLALLPRDQGNPLPLDHTFALRQAARSVFAESLLSIVEKQDLFLLVLGGAADGARLRKLQIATESALGLPVSVGVSQCVPVHQLHAAAEDAMEAVHSIPEGAESTLSYYADLLHSKKQHVGYPRQLEARLFDALRYHENVPESLVLELVSAMYSPGVPLEQSALMLLRLRVALYRFAEEYGLSDLPPFDGDRRPVQNARQAMQGILPLVSHMASQRKSTHQRAMEEIATKAQEIIESSYANASLNVASIAGRLYVSPGYLSRIYRQVQGETCMAYLTQVRLRAAQELLRNTNIKSYEIAEMVGYASPNYFSALFKKHTGLSPRQFRGETP